MVALSGPRTPKIVHSGWQVQHEADRRNLWRFGKAQGAQQSCAEERQLRRQQLAKEAKACHVPPFGLFQPVARLNKRLQKKANTCKRKKEPLYPDSTPEGKQITETRPRKPRVVAFCIFILLFFTFLSPCTFFICIRFFWTCLYLLYINLYIYLSIFASLLAVFLFFALWVLIYWNSIMMCYLGGHNVEVECVAKQNYYIDNFDNIIDSTVINHDSSCDMGITFFTIVLRLTA